MKVIYEAILPGWKGRKLPTAFPFYVRFGLRISIWIAHIAALRKYGRPFHWLNNEKRIKVIEYLYHHSNPMIRNLVQSWKLMAIMLHADG